MKRWLALLFTLTILGLPTAPARAQTEVFARGADGSLMHLGDSGSWRSLGGQVNGAPDACSWGVGRVDVFVRGADDQLWQIAKTGNDWTQWYEQGGKLTSSPSCVSWGHDRIDVFARGGDGSLIHKAWTGSGWSEWESLGGELQAGSSPDAASWGLNRIDVFIRGTDNALWQKAWNGATWSEWISLGGELASDPGAVSWGPDRIDVFARGSDGQIWQIAWDGSVWSPWHAQGGSFEKGSSPDAVSTGVNQLEIVARGEDSALWRKRWNGSQWQDWTRVEGTITSDPSATSTRSVSKTTKEKDPESEGKPSGEKTPVETVYVPPVITIDPNAVLTGVPAGTPQVPQVDVVITPEVAFGGAHDGWSFEEGLEGWTKTGTAFDNQPTFGDNVIALRVKTDMRLENNGIGGDYWKNVPYPIGHAGQYWIGTHENRPSAGQPRGGVAGDGATGTLTSPEFRIFSPSISFLIGGGNDLTRLRVELLVRASREQLEAARRDGGQPVRVGDHDYLVAAMATGQRSEIMRRERWDVSAYRLRGARIRIVDESSAAWGHINVDDFRLSDSLPPPPPMPLWGFADTHTHPANYLGFGGGLITGKLFSPHGERDALPPLLNHATFETLGLLGAGPLGLIASAIGRAATESSRAGWPEMRGYPAFNKGLGQKMYKDWVKRAHSGGLRLMSALAINNWLVSSHSTKKLALGSTAPDDDKGSADVQIQEIKRWVALPENQSWVEIATSPQEARRIIGENKLAIILGVELDLLGNFAPNRTWDSPDIVVLNPEPVTQAEVEQVRALVRAELERLHAMGVRQITPYHYVSGSFGGTAMFERLFNEQSRKFTGSNVVVASGAPYGIRYRLNSDGWGTGDATARELITGQERRVAWHQSWLDVPLGHINSMGLTRTGGILLEEMARLGLLLDIDHASYRTTEELLRRAGDMNYPVMASHIDPLDLGYTSIRSHNGTDEFTFDAGATDDGHQQNLANTQRFGTTILNNLRHEGMSPRSKYEAISRVGGVVGTITSTYRRKDCGSAIAACNGIVANDNDGSSKSWAQMYLYAVNVMGGKGVPLSTDQTMINFIAPRFGPNSGYMLGPELVDELKTNLRMHQVTAQTNGVRYDSPIRDWGSYRFNVPGQSSTDPWGYSAYRYTGKSWEYQDIWRAVAAFKADRNPWTQGDAAGIPQSGQPGNQFRILNIVKGMFAARMGWGESSLANDCPCLGNTIPERYAGYVVVKQSLGPYELADTNWTGDGNYRDHYRWVKEVWTHWHNMEGNNDPLRRHVFGNRDFDINIDGAAHYGMLPDFLQDLRNVGLTGDHLAPLFRSAEDYVQMWEKAESRRPQ